MLATNRIFEFTKADICLPPDSKPAQLPTIDAHSKAPTEANLCDWIASAAAGHAMQYHEGLLLRDRSEVVSEFPTKERARIHAVARRAWIACELGLVHLFSQKLEENHYRYLAIRTSHVLKPPEIETRLRTAPPAPAHRHPT